MIINPQMHLKILYFSIQVDLFESIGIDWSLLNLTNLVIITGSKILGIILAITEL